MQDDAGKQVPGLKQVVQVGGRACKIDIDPMDVPQRKRKQLDDQVEPGMSYLSCLDVCSPVCTV